MMPSEENNNPLCSYEKNGTDGRLIMKIKLNTEGNNNSLSIDKTTEEEDYNQIMVMDDGYREILI